MTMPHVGQRVRVMQDLDYFPHFTVKAGATGVVREVGDVVGGDAAMHHGNRVWVRLDVQISGAEYWGNEVHFARIDIGNGDYVFSSVVEVIDHDDDYAGTCDGCGRDLLWHDRGGGTWVTVGCDCAKGVKS